MIILRMVEDSEFMHTLSKCEVINADGIGVVWASKLGRPLPERVTGIDLMEALIGLAAEHGFKPYFLGAQEEVVQRTVSHYRQKYPKLEIAGYRNGYLRSRMNNKSQSIRDSGADMLFVAISSPKKRFSWVAGERR